MNENGFSARQKIEQHVTTLKKEKPTDYQKVRMVFYHLIKQEVISTNSLAEPDNQTIKTMRSLLETDQEYAPTLTDILFILDQLENLFQEMNELTCPFLLKQFDLI